MCIKEHHYLVEFISSAIYQDFILQHFNDLQCVLTAFNYAVDRIPNSGDDAKHVGLISNIMLTITCRPEHMLVNWATPALQYK